MAQETSNPKGIFVLAAILSAVGVVLFQQSVASYYDAMVNAEQYEKVLGLPAVQLDALRKGETQRLTSSPLPIDRAVKELSTRGREDPGLKDLAKTDITPQPSTDVGALTGWALLANTAAPAAAAASPAPAPSPIAAGSAAVAPDAGAATAPSDAGAAPVRAIPGARPAPRGGRR